MKFLLVIILSMSLIPSYAEALEIEAPVVPESGRDWMPENAESFQEGFFELLRKCISELHPDLKEAAQVSVGIISSVMIISFLRLTPGSSGSVSDLIGAVTVSSILLKNGNSMLRLTSETIFELSNYGKLLLPVMTTALAAQGNVAASGAIYAGTALFISILTEFITHIVSPGIYLFLALYIGSSATGEKLLKRIGDLIKSAISWILKLILMVFTTYLGLTGVVAGTTDAAALKAAKVTMSSFVPVVGGILSDASEAILISAGFLKNAAGIYGILAVLAVFLRPFIQIASHFLILKLTASICTVFTDSSVSELIDAFSSALGIMLGMTAAVCIMVLISTVCFMRGVG